LLEQEYLLIFLTYLNQIVAPRANRAGDGAS